MNIIRMSHTSNDWHAMNKGNPEIMLDRMTEFFTDKKN